MYYVYNYGYYGYVYYIYIYNYGFYGYVCIMYLIMDITGMCIIYIIMDITDMYRWVVAFCLV